MIHGSDSGLFFSKMIDNLAIFEIYQQKGSSKISEYPIILYGIIVIILAGMVFGVVFMCNPTFWELRTKRGCSGLRDDSTVLPRDQEKFQFTDPAPPKKTLSKAILLAPSNSGNWGLIGIPKPKKAMMLVVTVTKWVITLNMHLSFPTFSTFQTGFCIL